MLGKPCLRPETAMPPADDAEPKGHTLDDHTLGIDLEHTHDGYADHDHDFPEDGPLEENPIWIQDHVTLTSVGIDIGSSGTQVIFSRIHLRRLGEDLSSRYFVVSRETLFQSGVALTPYRSEEHIDEGKLGAIIDDAYNAAGDLVSTTDPDDHTTTYVYNDDDELTSTTDPDGGTTTTVYDAADNVVSVTDPDGDETTDEGAAESQHDRREVHRRRQVHDRRHGAGVGLADEIADAGGADGKPCGGDREAGADGRDDPADGYSDGDADQAADYADADRLGHHLAYDLTAGPADGP